MVQQALMKWEGGHTVNTERKHHQNLEDSQERMLFYDAEITSFKSHEGQQAKCQ